VTAVTALRPLALAGVALLAVLGVLATEQRVSSPSTTLRAIDPAGASRRIAVVVPLSSAEAPAGCALEVIATTLAVTHPTLPCGTRVVLEGDAGRVASIQVAGRTPVPAGATFGLTPALANAIGVTGPTALHWSLAAG